MKIKDFRRRIFMKPTIFCSMLYPVCGMVDMVMNIYLDRGIKKVEHGGYFLYIEFNGGVKAKLQNTNKYYGWLSSGDIGGFWWKDSRPRKSTMRRLIYELERYYSKQ